MKFSIGDRVSWRSINRQETGVIEQETPDGYIIRLVNGKCVIAAENSLQNEKPRPTNPGEAV